MNLNDFYKFDPRFYKENSSDLRMLELDELALVEHYQEFGKKERRAFASTSCVSDAFSMKYLRGSGLEIGCGDAPVRLCEGVACAYGDLYTQSYFDKGFGHEHKSENVDLNSDLFKHQKTGDWDFVIARHVLEHCDSFIRGLMNLQALVKRGGSIYVALPLLDKMADREWMPKHGLLHHAVEYFFPNVWTGKHADDFLKAQTPDELVALLGKEVSRRDFVKNYSYLMHRHNYKLSDWLSLILFANRFFVRQLELVDFAVCSDRDDLNLVFKKNDS